MCYRLGVCFSAWPTSRRRGRMPCATPHEPYLTARANPEEAAPTMTIDELIPSLGALSHADKLRLAQIVLQQLIQDALESAPPEPPAAEPFDPQRFYGAAHHSRQEIDQYLASAREGWQE